MTKFHFRQVWSKHGADFSKLMNFVKESVGSLPDKSYFEIIVKRYIKPRSLSQNNYYWMGIGMVADFLGVSPDELHESMKYKFLRKEVVIESTGEVLYFIGSSSKLNAQEFDEFVTKVWAFCATDLDFHIPPPNTMLSIKF